MFARARTMPISDAENTLGVVLAGGRSLRMGRDKALLEWNGHTLLDHAIARFHAAGIARVAVSGDRPEYGGIHDIFPQAGPLGGVHAVARAYSGHTLVIVPVDMPKVPAEWLVQLVERMGEGVAMHFFGSPFPLAIRANVELFQSLDARVSDPQSSKSVQDWLRDIAVTVLPQQARPTDALANLNTPIEWENMRT